MASFCHFAGADVVRFKAEVNFDGREITRCHLNRVDMELLLEVSADGIRSLNL